MEEDEEDNSDELYTLSRGCVALLLALAISIVMLIWALSGFPTFWR